MTDPRFETRNLTGEEIQRFADWADGLRPHDVYRAVAEAILSTLEDPSGRLTIDPARIASEISHPVGYVQEILTLVVLPKLFDEPARFERIVEGLEDNEP